MVEIVCCLRLNDFLARHLLTPIARHPNVSRLWVVRHAKIRNFEMPNIEYVLAPGRFKIWRFLRMIWICFQLSKREQVKGFVSFNPIPYGLFSYIAARRHKKAVHFGFIGSDWNFYASGRWGRWLLLPIARKADFVTVTGPSMLQQFLRLGFNKEKTAVLPHTVELDEFPVADAKQAKYSCIFVGQLIELKRVDLILQAFTKVLKSHRNARLCVVGDGPLAPELKAQARRLGIAEAVDFAGFVPKLQPYLSAARIVIIASASEGFPYVLVEGMCSGLVPVSTPVGTIPDVITNGENGLLFPPNNSDALAQCINRLLDEPQLYEKLRANVLKMRESFATQKAGVIWDNWLSKLNLLTEHNL